MQERRAALPRRLIVAAAVIMAAGAFAHGLTTPGRAVPQPPQGTPKAAGAGIARAPVNLVGAWRLVSYVKAENKVRYKTEGYMMFTKTHWMHIAYFNRDTRELDFSEAHHGTYTITGPDTAVLLQDIELHMDPKMEFQKTPVFYGKPGMVVNARYQVQGNTVVMDFKSGAQVVIERIE
jgi:hypothetical protein